MLMGLFISTLQNEVEKLHRNNIRLRFIGDRKAFSEQLQTKIAEGEAQTRNNTGLTLVVAANYGGRWDMSEAFKKIAVKIESGEISIAEVDEKLISQHLSTSDLPEPDLFIRTGGEQRVSNFLLWQLAYTELFFTPTLWPDFNRQSIEEAIVSFRTRQRRFGHTGEQIINKAVTL
jgi:undecaprenyl diphosphate synthase